MTSWSTAATTGISAWEGHLEGMADRQRGLYPHSTALTMLNLHTSRPADQPSRALACANEAILAEQTSCGSVAAAWLRRLFADVLGQVRGWSGGHRQFRSGRSVDPYERADIADSFVDEAPAASKCSATARSDTWRACCLVQMTWLTAVEGAS